MTSLLVVIAVTVLVFVWVRGTRSNRARWLKRLHLPGVWERDGEWGRLELTGGLDRGSYRLSDGGDQPAEAGTWVLHGHTLCLTSAGGERSECDLRLFEEGRIGIDGPRLERRVYRKVPSNVVPLRDRSGG
ncbi:MAG TPA: hypothetical protein VIS76_10470 [Pseudomonadales bacterium]